MKTSSPMLFFPFLILSCSLFSQENQEHEFDLIPGAIELDRDVEMNDSLYSVDSAYVVEQYALAWKLSNAQRFEEFKELLLREHVRVRDLIEYKLDTLLFEIYINFFGGLAWANRAIGQYEGNTELAKKSLNLFLNYYGEGNQRYHENMNIVAAAYKQIGDIEQALKYYKKCLELLKIYYPPGHRLDYYPFNNFGNIIITYRDVGEYNRAIYYGKKSVELAKERKMEHEALFSKVWLGLDYLDNNQKLKAFELEKQLEHEIKGYAQKKNAEKYVELEYLLLKSRVFFAKGNTAAALEKLKEFFVLNGKIYDKDSNSKYYIGKTKYLWQKAKYLATYDFDKAIKVYKNLIYTIADYYGPKNNQIFEAYHQLALLYLETGQIEKMLINHQKVLNIFDSRFKEDDLLNTPESINQNYGIPFLRALILKTEGLIEFAQVNENSKDIHAAALNTLRLAEEVAEGLRWETQWRSSKLRMGKWSNRIADNYIHIYNQLYHKTGNQDYLEKAFQQSQRNKATLMMAGLQEAKVKSFLGIPDTVLEKEAAFKKDISIYHKQIYDGRLREQPNDSLLGAWETQLLALNNQYQEFQKDLEQRYPKYHELKYKFPVYSVADIQQTLEPEEALIEYFAGDSSVYAFLLTPSTFETIELDHKNIKKYYNRLHGQLHEYEPTILSDQEQQIQFDQFAEVAYGLYQELIYPVLTNTEAEQLYIIPDGYLGHLPFHILLTTPPTEAQRKIKAYPELAYLFNDYTINQEYAVQLLMERKGIRSQKPTLAYAGFAPAYSGNELFANRNMDTLMLQKWYPEVARNGLSGLAFNQPEVDSVADYFPSGKAFLGAEATEENFKAYGLEAKVLHLAMHALTNEDNPLFSQLIFSQNKKDTLEDGFLHAYELYNTQLNAELAVLSACNTGSGQFAKGEGILSLSRAFKYAGCPNIAMSLWKADDKATHEIMVGFFKNLKDGMGKSRALKEAQRAYLDNHTGLKTHPYYWATFMMIGDDAPLSGGGMPWWGWGGLVILVGLIGWGVWRRRNDLAT